MRRSFCAFLLAAFFAVYSAPGEAKPKVDVDLAGLNSLMAYTGLFNIFTDPNAYIGKVIRLKGQFESIQDPETGIRYFAVTLMDASACCAVGMDFVLKGEHEYPGDYPKIGANVTVTGKFEMYQDGGETFCRLADAEMM